jgi:hypothetical protein
MSYQKRIVNKDAHFPFVEKAKSLFEKKDKDELPYIGSYLYFGYQGQGKTLTMVKHLEKLHKKYPKAIIVSNLQLKNIEYKHFESFTQLMTLFKTLDNGKYGVIYAIDEMHNYFHSHDSRDMPLWIVQVFSQQRKRRVLVLGTAQLWQDVTKAIRDQYEYIIQCVKYGPLIVNKVLDVRDKRKEFGQEIIPVKRIGFYFTKKSIYQSYDTLQVINSGRSIFGGIEPIDININQVAK